ncbi:MAG TPA: DUF2268 domain-containing putative Zn-dependent protease [Chloroflexaceae bacterium]|nr:DUF2268 domain-containing putative Zn-dependent protease [Chloroflexaceae bacterium]
MEIHWEPTDAHLRAIVAAEGAEAKLALYREHILAPWAPMMRMMAPMFRVAPDDELGVARAWGWPLPDELAAVPEAMARLEAAGAWRAGEAALREAVGRFAGQALPFERVEGWLMPAVPERSNPVGRGYTGAVDFTRPRLVCQYSEPDEANLRALPGAVAHEFHHLIRLRVFPWDMERTTVADYIVHEGMAESFATAIFGPEVLGFYVSAIGAEDLERARALVGAGLERSGFDVIRGYIFGDSLAGGFGFDKVGMPDYGGYAIGYHVVQTFLRRTGRTVEEATFLPAGQIVAESGYFG